MRVLLFPVCLLAGCAWFDKAKDDVVDVFEPLVAVGIVAHVEAPEGLPDGVDLPDDLQTGASATFFLADAREVSDLEEAPVPGAVLELSGCDESVELTDNGDGSYTTLAALRACGASDYVVERTDGDEPAVLPVTLPAAQDAGVPATHEAGAPLQLDLSRADWNAAIVVVVDVEAGDVTWTSEPEGIAAWYQLLKGQQDLTAVTIPGEAFRADTTHVVAVTGLLRTKGGDLEGVNNVLSTIAGGRTAGYPLSTRAIPTE